MRSASQSKTKSATRGKTRRTETPAAPAEAERPSALMRFAHELRSYADSALGLAEGATEMTIAAARSLARSPQQKAAIGTAGEFLRAAREAAGITVAELGAAVGLSDTALIEEAEEGKAALPFDLVLRLAGVLGRNDPISFALKLTRSYYPGIWKALDDLGVGKLVLQVGRERDFANLYRANDAARRLSDDEFAHVLRFVGAAFDMAMEFRAAHKARPAERSSRRESGPRPR
ncbi:MAG TPA: helix-turn-helix domain-containing protein [Roseiarcus sp.]|nr:helix-turn-helix domain-containing protein [Roseiarcus sp.]